MLRSPLTTLLLLAGCDAAAVDSPLTVEQDTGFAFPTTREAWQWPFASDSPWNLPVGDGLALEEEADPCTRAVREEDEDAWVNAEEWSHPLVRAEASDPTVELWNDGEPWGVVTSPADALPSEPAWPEGDAHLHIIDPEGNTVTEMWRARRREDGGWDTDSVAAVDLRGPGVGTDGVRIYGGSAIGGLWRTGEVDTGAWHALALSLPLEALKPEWVFPATTVDSSREDEMTGPVPVGQHVALPADVDVRSLKTPAGRALARTLRDYGAYVVDHAGNFALYAEPDAVQEIEPMREDIDTIRDLLRCSTNNRAETPGGPGERVQPPAPPFAD